MRLITPLAIGAAIGAGLAAAAARLHPIPAWSSRDDQLEGLTKDELYERAQAADIPGRSGMTKDELLHALRSGL